MRKLIACLSLVIAFGCERAESVADVDTVAAPMVMKTNEGAAPPESTAPRESAMPRMIVRTADVRVIVADTAKAVDVVTKNVEALGGYVSGSNIWRDGELLRAKLTLRVPSDKLTPALASIRGLAKRVESETVTSEDVSQEYVDLDSQLRNLQATETELRELLTTIRQNTRKASEVLEIHQQITTIRGQIEHTQGRMRYLSQVTAMSSIALELTPDALAQPVVQPGWQPLVVVKDASRALVGVLQSTATAAIWFAIYVLPILIVLVALMLALWRVLRGVIARRDVSSQAS